MNRRSFNEAVVASLDLPPGERERMLALARAEGPAFPKGLVARGLLTSERLRAAWPGIPKPIFDSVRNTFRAAQSIASRKEPGPPSAVVVTVQRCSAPSGTMPVPTNAGTDVCTLPEVSSVSEPSVLETLTVSIPAPLLATSK